MKTWMRVLDGIFDLKDKVNASLGRETSEEWNKRMIKEYYDHLRGLNVPDLQKILNEIQEDWKSGLYHRVIIAFEERQMNCRSLTFEELLHNKLTTLASQTYLQLV